ncbi:hypothetical protein [Candidatus Methylacidiphilum fumarolicum]|uniref:hypothetical protein n=1 Tax=Candidatus Methylacidiphilum fumarolicum TaxID=591154 RepID=UPI000A6590BB|nr:hypothetical protein [Candidatus Methylacidiphilum fumarolicum]
MFPFPQRKDRLVAAPFGFFFAGYIHRLVKRKAKERKEATIGLGIPFFLLFLLD